MPDKFDGNKSAVQGDTWCRPSRESTWSHRSVERLRMAPGAKVSLKTGKCFQVVGGYEEITGQIFCEVLLSAAFHFLAPSQFLSLNFYCQCKKRVIFSILGFLRYFMSSLDLFHLSVVKWKKKLNRYLSRE